MEYQKGKKMKLTPEQSEKLISVLKDRFEKNRKRHKDLDWAKIQAKLEVSPEKLWSLNEMERTGGEPDVVGRDPQTGEYLFCDCSAESPAGRRQACYDSAAAEKRPAPGGNVLDLAAAMGIELVNEEQYRMLQTLGQFDTKTDSWVQTPAEIRQLGGALFCHRRYDQVFVFHNGAPSWYSGRGFRGSLRV